MYGHFSFPKLSKINKVIIIAIAAVSGLWLLAGALKIGQLKFFLYLLTVLPKNFMPWQPVTYFLLNPDIWSILFSCLAIWMFGSVVEQRIGQKAYIIMLVLATIGAATFFWPLSYFFKTAYPLYGVTSATLSLLCAFAYFWPNSKIYVFGIFPVKSKWLVLGYGIIMLLSVTGGFSGARSKHALVMYLSLLLGVLVSITYVHFKFFNYHFLKAFAGKFKTSVERKSVSRRRANTGSASVVDIKEWERNQVDNLLEKVSKYGINSLNKKEKDFLDRVSSEYSSGKDKDF